MYEPQDPRPLDPPEAFDLPDGKEEWVAEKAMEVRAYPKLMFRALEWDGEQTGTIDIYRILADWMMSRQYFDEEEKDEKDNELTIVLQELAERYAEYVLYPAFIASVNNGDFLGD